MQNRVAFYSLGCKLNQLESEECARSYTDAGSEVLRPEGARAPDDADTVIVHTCTVTSKAEQKARRLIRSLLAESTAQIIVTGCYAKLNGKDLEALDGGKKRLRVVPELTGGAVRAAPPVLRTRAAIKISDGCDNKCAYCRVRLARGPGRSVGARELLSRARELEAAGTAELTLTGVNISQYDDNGTDLPALLGLLLDGTNSIALRLTSLHPSVFTEAFYKAASRARIRPHFHLSVQSAAPRVLSGMGRAYSADALLDAIARLRSLKNDPFVACDVIAGFPGETDEDFELTRSFCERADFAWIHAFPFSARPGTPAFDMKDKVPERAASLRTAILLKLAREGKKRYIERCLGGEVFAVPEETTARVNGLEYKIATSENYLHVALPAGGRLPNRGGAVRCRLTACCADGGEKADVFGEVI